MWRGMFAHHHMLGNLSADGGMFDELIASGRSRCRSDLQRAGCGLTAHPSSLSTLYELENIILRDASIQSCARHFLQINPVFSGYFCYNGGDETEIAGGVQSVMCQVCGSWRADR